MSKIKNHRRNKAQDKDTDYYRFSVPTTGIQLPDLNLSPQYETPVKYRASDMTNIALKGTILQRNATLKTNTHPSQQSSQKTSNLRQFISQIKQKLELAKKQLNLPVKNEMNQSNFQLNSFKQSCSNSSKWQQPSINLSKNESKNQSSKKLISFFKSSKKLPTLHATNNKKHYYIKELTKGLQRMIHHRQEQYNRAIQHLNQSLSIIKKRNTINIPTYCIQSFNVHLPIKPQNKGKQVLVIDLDQTLIHSQNYRTNPDQIQVPSHGQLGKQMNYISIRPYAISFLKKISKKFQIIAFTAGIKSYADAVLNLIDPQEQYIHHRLYRQHCTKIKFRDCQQNQNYIKDLRILNRDLSKVVIVDNNPISYLYQLDNAIPILPYESGQDFQLLALEKYLQNISKMSDVRILNRQVFKLQEYIHYENYKEIIQDLYCKQNCY